MSSPMKVSNSSHCDDSDDMYTSSTEPSQCYCQNQLAHVDWNGVLRENLPELCRRSLGIIIENMSVSSDNDENSALGSTIDDIDLETNTDPNPEWKQVILRRASRNRLNDLNRKASASVNVGGTTLTDTNGEVGNVVENSHADNSHAEEVIRPKGRKRRLSDREDGDTWTSKKAKKGMDIQIKIRDGKKRPTVKISVKII